MALAVLGGFEIKGQVLPFDFAASLFTSPPCAFFVRM